MPTVKSLYPSTSSTALSITLAGLASDTSLLSGRASAYVDNTALLDLDHAVGGVITASGSGTIEVWAYAAYKSASGTPTFPDSISGTDAAKTITSQGIKMQALAPIASIAADGTANRPYPFREASIANLFGMMPKYWGIFVTQGTGNNLASADIQFERSQAQSV